jgi:ornithine decarboxylase
MIRTPALVMNLSAVEAAYRRFTATMPSIAVHYAMKCNPQRDVLATLRSLGCRFEIASASELDQLLALGVDPSTVLYSNPVKPGAHIRGAYAGGVRCFAFDSLDEAAKLAALAPGSNAIVRLGTCAARSGVPSEGKFGVDPDTAVRLLARARSLGLCPFGVAFHVGSQMLSPKAWQPPLVAVRLMMHQLADMGIFLQMVDLGGGFPARYGVIPPPLERYAAVIKGGLDALPYPVRAVVEPGRAIAAEAGTLTATVIGTAVRGGKRWIHLDVGAFNGLMESLETGNELRFPVSDSRDSAVRDRFQLTGPTCDSQDTILFDVELSADLSTGDLVHIGTAGAYTTAYASTFNGFEVPTVRCVSGSRPFEAAIDCIST